MTDALGWIATSLTLAGCLLVALKLRVGWIIQFISAIIWLWYAYLLPATPLFAINTAFLFIHTLDYFNWRKEKK